MNILTKFIPVAILLAATSTAFAHGNHADAATAVDSTTKKVVVNYRCDGKQPLKVTYGFNKQGIPTYAQATLNGKSRMMPINLNRTDSVDTVFGDENNFSISAGTMNSKNYRSAIQVQSPSSNIIYKSCTAR